MTTRPLLDALAADPQKALADIAAERARRRAVAAGKWSFGEFAINAWPIVDNRPCQWNNYLDWLALHLDLVARGRIKRLVGTGPPRMGKPVWEEEYVVERVRGRVRLREITVGDEVLTHRGRFRRVLAVHKQGELPLLKVTTHLNRALKTAPDHPYLTTRGWVEARDLRDGDVLASVHAAKRLRLARSTRREFPRVLHEDPLATVENAGSGLCRCLTVEEDHTFVAGDLVVHNSNLFAIMWPAWIWACVDPAECFIYLSYSLDLTREHSTKCRALIESAWYQDTFRPRWQLGYMARSDARDDAPWRHAHGNRQDDFINTAGGRRIAASIEKGVIGRGATKICVDDPIDNNMAGSVAQTLHAREAVSQAVATRFNDPTTGAAVMLMQRFGPDDPAQWAIDAGWQHFCTPMERDDRQFKTVDADGAEVWRDTRQKGELLAPDRFPPDTLASMKKTLGVVRWAAQGQQDPMRDTRAGQMFNRGMFKILESAPSRDRVVRVARCWDFASTEGDGGILTSTDPDWSVGGRVSLLDDGLLVVEHVADGQWGPRMVRQQVKNISASDGPDVEVSVPQDPGQAGKAQAQEFASMLLGRIVHTPRRSRSTGDKVTHAGPASSQAQAGNIAVVRGPWNERFFQVLEAFPDPAVHDDHVDVLADAVHLLAVGEVSTAQLWSGVVQVEDDRGDDWTR